MTDENFKTCIQFTYSHLKYHRFLSVNSHEIKREVDGICEKLRFSNFHDTEKKFKRLVEETVTHELAVNHYEKDVIYGIISLLTTLAYDPINNLKSKLLKGQDVIVSKPASVKVPPKTSDMFINSLLKDNFKLQRNEADSDLSEWTDSDDEDCDEKSLSDESEDEKQVSPLKACITGSLKPPEKPSVFKTVTVADPEKWLTENIQNSWWNDECTSISVTSSHPAANFCKLWQKHLSDKSLGFIKPRPVSLIPEYCLLREIFWMFSNPVSCKFFIVGEDEISLRPDVSMPSTMPESLNIFLSDFLRNLNLMQRLKVACIKSYQLATLSHTIQTYFNVVQSKLDQIIEFMLEEEETVKSQKESYTIVKLHNKLRPHAKMLEMLWNIHSTSVLDNDKYPPHICSCYLLASLNNHVQSSCKKEKKNLAIVLLMTCLRPFFEIFEIWWTEARLDDLKHEFLMEKNAENEFEQRLLAKSKEKSFYLNDAISKTITDDSIIALMMNYSLKACFTLDIISQLDRVHEMRQTVNDSTPIYDEFLNRINEEIQKFAQPKQTVLESKTCEPEVKTNSKLLNNQSLVNDIKSGMLANGDELLLLAFQSTFDRLTQTPFKTSETPQLDLYDVLNDASDFILLPLERSIDRIIHDLLLKKIAVAERFVMNIYFNEFNVQQNLKEIRKVFFLESNELTNFFCQKLFPQMDAGESLWANPYLLTVALNDVISMNYQNTSTLFSVEVKRNFKPSMLEAVDDLTLHFNVNKNLVNVFTPSSIKKYNEGKLSRFQFSFEAKFKVSSIAFRFLLKIKWGQRILNCLLYPNFFKHRAPYAKMQMIDLVIKRLSLTRFAMQHSINSLHNHLMVMLQGLSHQLDVKVSKAQNLSELICYHESFVDAFHGKCFLGADSSNTFGIIIEMLKLTKVLKDEWRNVTAFAALDESGCIETISLGDLNNNTLEIEKAFGVCEYQLKVLLDI